MTLPRALQILAEDSPGTLAVRARIGGAQAEVDAARIVPNPSFDYAGTRLRSGTNTGAATVDELGLDWPLLIFGQRGARIRAAKSGVDAARAHIDDDLALRAREVRFAFGELLAQQERTRIVEEARTDLQRVATIVAKRQEAGEASEYDSLRVQTEYRAADAAWGDARADLADARGRLAVLLGRPGSAPHADGELAIDAAAPLDLEALWPAASEKLPALQAARRDEQAARDAVTAAQRDARPVPSLSGGVELTEDARSTAATFGLTIPLPFFDRNQGAVARARAEAEEAALRRAAVEAEVKADLERAVAVASSRRAALAELDAAVSARLPEMRSMAEAAYREGRGNILELLDAFRSLSVAQLARVDAFAQAAHAEAEVAFLTGRAMEP